MEDMKREIERLQQRQEWYEKRDCQREAMQYMRLKQLEQTVNNALDMWIIVLGGMMAVLAVLAVLLL